MSVILPFPVESIEVQGEQPSYTYRLDLDSKRIFGVVDGIEAVNQAIRKALITVRFRCAIYSNQYGSELQQTIIANDVTREFVETEVPWLIKDTLRPDTRILSVQNFEFEFFDDEAYVSFEATTIFGTTFIREVII